MSEKVGKSDIALRQAEAMRDAQKIILLALPALILNIPPLEIVAGIESRDGNVPQRVKDVLAEWETH